MSSGKVHLPTQMHRSGWFRHEIQAYQLRHHIAYTRVACRYWVLSLPRRFFQPKTTISNMEVQAATVHVYNFQEFLTVRSDEMAAGAFLESHTRQKCWIKGKIDAYSVGGDVRPNRVIIVLPGKSPASHRSGFLLIKGRLNSSAS